jgi:hypothetical protein
MLQLVANVYLLVDWAAKFLVNGVPGIPTP